MVEAWLASGERRRELSAWFGEAEYNFLQQLAVAAAAVTPDPQRCVYYVPGLMGSQLSIARERRCRMTCCGWTPATSSEQAAAVRHPG